VPILKLAIDRQNRRLVNYNGTPVDFPPLFQFNVQQLQIYPLDPPANISGAYQSVDASANGLRVAICSQPTGSTGDDTRLTFQTSFTWNATNHYFSGELDLSAAAIATYLGTAAERSAWFEVNLMDGADPTTILQQPFALKALGDNFSTVAPTPTDQYYTQVQSDDRFAKKTMSPGERLVIPSPGSIYALELGCADDGSVIMNVITL
jgi:hypothetical protein